MNALFWLAVTLAAAAIVCAGYLLRALLTRGIDIFNAALDYVLTPGPGEPTQTASDVHCKDRTVRDDDCVLDQLPIVDRARRGGL